MNKTNRPHLIRHSHFFDPDEYECSSCGAVFKDKLNKCPNCGASFLGEKDDGGWVDEAEEMDWLMGDDD